MHLLKGNPSVNTVTATIVVVSLLIASFSLFEPMVTYGQNNPHDFTVTQEIQSEISFLTTANDVTMDTALNGLTGGTSNGSTTFNVTTNDPDGYTVGLTWGSTTAMLGTNAASSSYISNYAPTVGGTPDYTFAVSSGDAEFGYTVVNETTLLDVDDRFQHNLGGACNTGGTFSSSTNCWYNIADAENSVTLIDASAATAGTGATSTIYFRVGVGANPVPALETGFYTATGTLTATVN